MELYQLKYFLYAAKYENISKAAQALRVSQPSISRAVVALEKELQVELFERQGKRIILTRAGLTFREQISPILWKLEGLGDEMKKMQKGGDTIRLNAMSVVSLLSGIIKKFREEEPDAAFVVTDQKESTDWHLCILSAGPGISYQGGQELLSEEVFLGASSRTWLGERDEISLRDVENENFILLPRGTVLRNLADTRFREHHFIPQLSMECNSTHLVRSLVSDQVGITLWPEYSWGKRPDVHMVRIAEPGFYRSVFLLRQKSGEIPPAAERFAQFVEDYMRTLEHEK